MARSDAGAMGKAPWKATLSIASGLSDTPPTAQGGKPFQWVGIGRVARTTPDGYTIGIGTVGTNVLNGAFYSLPYDLLGDLTPIALMYTTPYVLPGE
jgi:tripartite-type tricarboxylate transporter receptor subunit TctC